jgi:hypothetical protein
VERLICRRVRRLGFVAGALYALMLVVAPFEHHDLACHQKTPQHCTSCSTTIVGSAPSELATDGACALTDAGRAFADPTLAQGTLRPVRSTGRSPPARD